MADDENNPDDKTPPPKVPRAAAKPAATRAPTPDFCPGANPRLKKALAESDAPAEAAAYHQFDRAIGGGRYGCVNCPYEQPAPAPAAAE